MKASDLSLAVNPNWSQRMVVNSSQDIYVQYKVDLIQKILKIENPLGQTNLKLSKPLFARIFIEIFSR